MVTVAFYYFFFSGTADQRDLHVLTTSFPTRRSADLSGPVKAAVPVFSRVCAASSSSTGAPLRRHCSLRWRSSSSPDRQTAQCSVPRSPATQAMPWFSITSNTRPDEPPTSFPSDSPPPPPPHTTTGAGASPPTHTDKQ